MAVVVGFGSVKYRRGGDDELFWFVELYCVETVSRRMNGRQTSLKAQPSPSRCRAGETVLAETLARFLRQSTRWRLKAICLEQLLSRLWARFPTSREIPTEAVQISLWSSVSERLPRCIRHIIARSCNCHVVPARGSKTGDEIVVLVQSRRSGNEVASLDIAHLAHGLPGVDSLREGCEQL